jgi:hypothetical protein
MKTFTCIAKCGTCGSVMNTAHGVPEEDKGQVTMSAPMVAFCEVRSHNSLSDVNWNLKLEWVEETTVMPTGSDAEALGAGRVCGGQGSEPGPL